MIKKLLVVMTLVTVIVACGDKKKDSTEAPKFAGVAALVESADSLLALDEVTLVGKLAICPVSQEDVVLVGKGAFVKVALGEGVALDETLLDNAAAVTGKLSFVELDEAAIAELEAKCAEVKETCAKKAEEVATEGNATAEPKKCCAEKEGKSCCSAPKVGDKIFTLTATKIEKFECPNKDKCCKDGEKKCCEKKEGEKCCKDKEAKSCEGKTETKTE
jgi:hypothetical protein